MSIDQPIFVLRETAECPHCGLHQYLTANVSAPGVKDQLELNSSICR
jgi:hypothetical protein